jgi:hypothetical protein
MSDGGLDELFSSRDEPVEEITEVKPPKQRSTALWLLRNALLVAAATVVTVAALRAGHLHAPLILIIAAFIGLRLILLAVSQVSPPKLPRRRGGANSSSSGPASDALRAAVRRWERTLDRAHADPDVYSRNVLPVLAELTDERLRLRHGITRASDPRRARELLGDPMWQALHEPGRRAGKTRDIETFVDVLERL